MTNPFMVSMEVGAVIAPPTTRVPAIFVFPLDAVTVNLSVLINRSPANLNIPPMVALLVTDNPVSIPVNKVVPEKVFVSSPVWVYAPDALIPVTPVKKPPVDTLSPDDVNENAPVLLPIVVLLVPVVLILVVPTKVAPAVAVNNPLRVTLSPMFAVSSVVSFLTQ